jgi:hypothetical protein
MRFNEPFDLSSRIGSGLVMCGPKTSCGEKSQTA